MYISERVEFPFANNEVRARDVQVLQHGPRVDGHELWEIARQLGSVRFALRGSRCLQP